MGHKSHQLHCDLKLRVSEREKAAFSDAASVAGLTVSAWVRMVLRERVGPVAFEPRPFEGKGLVS